MKHLFYGCVILSAYLMVGTVDYQVAEDAQAERVLPQPVPEIHHPPFAPQNDPVRAPRCPKLNAEHLLLLSEIAMQADGGEWIHSCRYGIQI